MASLIPQSRIRFTDANGVPLVGGSVATYAAGTLIPKATFTDQSGVTPNVNPTPLDDDGGASMWFTGAYKVDVKDANGNSLEGYPVDNIVIYDLIDWSDLTATIAELNATDTSTLSKTSTYTTILSDRGKTILCDATSAGFTVNLLAAATATNGYEITIKKTDVSTNIVTIDGATSETIEGRTTFLLYDQNDVVTLLCDGNNWRVKSGVIRGNTVLKSEAFTTTIDDINQTFICAATVAYAVTLLSAVTAGDGFRKTFKKSSDGNVITLTPAGSETIDGDANFILYDPWDAVTILSNGGNWLVINSTGTDFETGDIKYTVDSTPPSGWISYNGATIGNAASNATNRANADTQSLFLKLWNNVTNNYSPIFNSDGTIGTRGADAITDFTANRAIKLPGTMGQVIGIAGQGSLSISFTADSTTDQLTLAYSSSLIETGDPISFNTTGALPAPLAISTTYYAIRVSNSVIQVATTLTNAIAGTAINLTNNGSGTNNVVISYTSRAVGESVGEETHALTTPETPSHTHSYIAPASTIAGAGGGDVPIGGVSATSGATGGSTAHNNMQPTQFVNVYIKL